MVELDMSVPLMRSMVFAAEKIGGAAEAKKDQEELDQVAGNAEDEIGERIAAMREVELLYGAHSLLASFGPQVQGESSSCEPVTHLVTQPTHSLDRTARSERLRHSHSASSCA